jgi:enoyl-CoA hydratase/carnithine racemase
VILTGEDPAFCAGHDIRLDNPLTATLFKGMQDGQGEPVRLILQRIKGILSALEDLPVPTIAAINGAAFGGGVELALCCDLRVLDREATLCMVETRIGLMPDLGGTVRLAALLGRSHALDLICTARDVRAEEALALGLVNRLAPPGRSLEVALDLAALVVQNGPAAVRGVKRVVMSMQQRQAHLETETQEAVACILAGEALEGVGAWMQKRPPKFKSKE